MYQGKKILGVIIARGGSKGVPGKNLREVLGRPLISWTIEVARNSKLLTRTILSSEDSDIIFTAKRFGCEVPFVRPAELSEDHVSGVEPVIHAVESLPGYDYVVLLQATSPLRSADDIDCAIRLCVDRGVRSCISVNQPSKSPYWMYQVSSEGYLRPLIERNDIHRRQDLPEVFALNGAVYVVSCSALLAERRLMTSDCIPYVMPFERSVDIDSEFDFMVFETLAKGRASD
jgi:N-acylneuraminate cytidylyltransferase